MLVKGLSKKERRIFDFCRKVERTSRDVAQRFEISIYHASTTLKKLHRLTMLDRTEHRDTEGKHFLWRGII